jgi:hypothetical protein
MPPALHYCINKWHHFTFITSCFSEEQCSPTNNCITPVCDSVPLCHYTVTWLSEEATLQVPVVQQYYIFVTGYFVDGG